MSPLVGVLCVLVGKLWVHVRKRTGDMAHFLDDVLCHVQMYVHCTVLPSYGCSFPHPTSLLSSSHTHTHTHTHCLSLSLSSLNHSHCHSLPPSLSLSPSPSLSLSPSLSPSLSLPLSLSLPPILGACIKSHFGA